MMIILATIILSNLSYINIDKSVFKVEKEFNDIEYYDCRKTQKLEIGKDYWLGCTSATDFMKSYITFINNNKVIKFYFFIQPNVPKQKNLYLSTFQNPQRGFSLNDLNYISKYLNLPKPELENEEYYIQDIYPYGMMFKEVDKKKYVMIYSITGGRNPEGIKVIKLLEVSISKDYQEKYFKL